MLKFRIFTSGLFVLLGMASAASMASANDLDNIRQVAEEYVRAAHPGKTVTFESARLNWHSNGKQKAIDGKGEVQPGGYNARFTVDNGMLQVKKLQLLKEDGKWQVVSELKPEQIHAAHPLTAPFRDKPRYTLKAIAAQYFEKNVYNKEGGWQKIKEPGFITCDGGEKPGQIAYCEVPYGIFYKGEYMINGSYLHSKCTAQTYLFENKKGVWVVKETLPVEKKIDGRTGKVIDRKGDIFGC